jgi:hypothetical protein
VRLQRQHRDQCKVLKDRVAIYAHTNAVTLWVTSSFPHPKGRTQVNGIWEGPKREKVLEDSRELYNVEFHNLYSTKYYYGDWIKEDNMGGTFSTHWSSENFVRNLRWKILRGILFWSCRHWRKDTFEIHLNVIWRWLDSAGSWYGPVAGSCEHGNEPSGTRDFSPGGKTAVAWSWRLTI